MDLLKMYALLNMGIFHCYVSLPEGNHEADDLFGEGVEGANRFHKMYQTMQAAGEAVDKMLTQDAFGAQQCLGFQAIFTVKNHGFCEFQPEFGDIPYSSYSSIFPSEGGHILGVFCWR